jgi:ubiquinone/menaquinone biosynthesis C-methylase UbiE
MKFRQRDKLLDLMDWHEVRSILDVGCGPGLLLIGGAKKAPEAKAVGVDVWQRSAESGNKPDRVMENARIEGVSERLDVRDGDVRSLPFPDSTFDMVLSRAALHNLKDERERQKGVGEIVRVLAPKGQVGLIIVDSWHLGEYLDLLHEGGVSIHKVLRPPRYFPPGLLFLTIVVGRKQ